jgi:hypothetical protein
MSMLFEFDPDIRDADEGTYGYCAQCECNVHAARMDFGIGPFEYWGSKEVHHDWREVCPKCEGDLSDPQHDEQEV